MTQSQYLALMSTVQAVGERVERIEERLAFVYPTDVEAREQIERELQSILAPACEIKVFADD